MNGYFVNLPDGQTLMLWPGCHFNINTLRLRQNGRHFADNLFKRIFLSENVWNSIKISPRFVPKCPIDNIPALVQMMAWHRPGAKPLSETMMVRLPTHMCVTRPQWVKMASYTYRDSHYKDQTVSFIRILVRWHIYIESTPDLNFLPGQINVTWYMCMRKD